MTPDIDSAAADDEAGTGRERLCVVTREHHDPSLLIRFVASPDGMIVPDVAGKLPGRGAWVRALPSLVSQALEKGKLARALGLQRADAMAVDQLDALLLRRCQDILSIGRRNGMVLGGGGKIRAAGRIAGLMVATDASPREARALAGDVDHDWSTTLMTGEEIGSVFGRASIAFAAVLDTIPRQADRIRDEIFRLRQWRGVDEE